jgi:hypothetical protein
MKTTLFLATLITISSCLFAQSSAIHGKVIDEFGEPMYSVNISVKGGSTTTGGTTDLDGNFRIKPLNAGTYNIEASFIGYDSVIITEVIVYNNQITFLDDIKLSTGAFLIKGEAVVYEYRQKLISKDEPSKIPISSEMIIKTPGPKNPAMLARAYQSDVQVVGDQMVIRGSRPGSSTVYIDGMRVTNEMSSLPSMGIGSMEIYTGGIPAKYGDVTGGVVMMTTKSYFDIVNERNAQDSRTKN